MSLAQTWEFPGIWYFGKGRERKGNIGVVSALRCIEQRRNVF